MAIKEKRSNPEVFIYIEKLRMSCGDIVYQSIVINEFWLITDSRLIYIPHNNIWFLTVIFVKNVFLARLHTTTRVLSEWLCINVTTLICMCHFLRRVIKGKNTFHVWTEKFNIFKIEFKFILHFSSKSDMCVSNRNAYMTFSSSCHL